MYRDVEEKAAPAARTNQTASIGIALATENKPYRGHKGLPFFNMWRGVDWESNFCDIMHDFKTFCEMFLKGVVGYRFNAGVFSNWDKDDAHRLECKMYDTFPEVFDDSKTKLPWRLSKDDVETLDRYLLNLTWINLIYLHKFNLPV